MCDRDHSSEDQEQYEALGLITRKQFGILLAAGVAMLLPKVANAVTVAESDVTVKTPDGSADCYFVHPSSGNAPGVLVWPDIFGLRPALRQMGRRLAESGYSVLVVNPFYRTQKAPTAAQGAATPIQQVLPLAQTLNASTHVTDAKAFIGWLDQQPSVARNRKIGTQGYCMGGAMAFRTAYAVPDRVGAVASFHGGNGLVTANPDSPHLPGPYRQGTAPGGHCAKRRCASPHRKDRDEGHFRQGGAARGSGSVPSFAARLVSAGFGGLQRAECREGMEPFAGAVRQGSRVTYF